MHCCDRCGWDNVTLDPCQQCNKEICAFCSRWCSPCGVAVCRAGQCRRNHFGRHESEEVRRLDKAFPNPETYGPAQHRCWRILRSHEQELGLPLTYPIPPPDGAGADRSIGITATPGAPSGVLGVPAADRVSEPGSRPESVDSSPEPSSSSSSSSGRAAPYTKQPPTTRRGSDLPVAPALQQPGWGWWRPPPSWAEDRAGEIHPGPGAGSDQDRSADPGPGLGGPGAEPTGAAEEPAERGFWYDGS